MVWKNQESWEPWLAEFLGNRHSKVQKILPKLFALFLGSHYEFSNCFEILNFVFSNTIPTGVQPVKILTLGLVILKALKIIHKFTSNPQFWSFFSLTLLTSNQSINQSINQCISRKGSNCAIYKYKHIPFLHDILTIIVIMKTTEPFE